MEIKYKWAENSGLKVTRKQLKTHMRIYIISLKTRFTTEYKTCNWQSLLKKKKSSQQINFGNWEKNKSGTDKGHYGERHRHL